MDAKGAIASHAVRLNWEAIDGPARLAAATSLHDSLCVGIAGAQAPQAAFSKLLGLAASGHFT